MNISDPRSLRRAADEALAVGRLPKQVSFTYAGLLVLVSVVVSALNYVTASQLKQATGLSNLDTNTVWSTVELLLPMVQMIAQICLNLGYLYAMLRIGRKLYADRNDLKEGLRRIGPALRCTGLQFLILLAVCFVLAYPISFLYMLTPFARPMLQAMEPIVMAPDPMALMEDPAVMDQIMAASVPMLVFSIVVYLVVMIPILFRFRMANYLLAEQGGCGAFRALRESFRMTRGNCMKLLKVDLHLWWYHGLILLLNLVLYADLLCELAGIRLPVSQSVAFYGCQGLYLVGLFLVYAFLRNRVELTYVMAYESLRPKETKQNSVVLGNIFQM